VAAGARCLVYLPHGHPSTKWVLIVSPISCSQHEAVNPIKLQSSLDDAPAQSGPCVKCIPIETEQLPGWPPERERT